MELYQLRSFATVAQLGHLTRAAEKLHVSQSALSAQIRALEDELEVILFERTASGMLLTSAGKRLLPQAEKAIEAAQTLRNEARAIKGEVAGTVSVGTLSDPEFIRLGEFMAIAVERYPMLEIQLPHEVSGAAFERVKEGELDASFYYGGLTHPSVAALRLRDVAYRVTAPAAWSERIEQADWAAIAREPWIMTPPISTHHQLASAMFREHAVEPAKVVEADNETVISSLVVSGLGMALMREEIAHEKAMAGAVVLWRDIRLVTTLQFIYLKQRERDPVIHALTDVLKDLWDLRQADKRPPRRRAGVGRELSK